MATANPWPEYIESLRRGLELGNKSQMARAIGVSRQTYARYMRGAKIPSITVQRLMLCYDYALKGLPLKPLFEEFAREHPRASRQPRVPG